MLANFFKKSVPISFVALLLLLFGFIGFKSFGVEKVLDFDLFYLFISRFLFFSSFLFIVSFIVSKNKLTEQNYYALFVFTVLFGVFPNTLELSRISISHLLVLLAFRRIYSLQFKRNRLLKLYDSGFLLGVAFFLYPLSLLFFFLVYSGYALYVKTIEKELLLPFIGFITPVFLGFSYYFVFDDMGTFRNILELNIGFDFRAIKELFSIRIIIALLMIVAIFVSIKKLQVSDNESKNKIRLVLSHMLLSIIVILAYNFIVEESIQFAFFPLSILIGVLIETIKKQWLKEFVMFGLLILSLIGFIV